MSRQEKPLPIINEDNAQYWRYARQHELRMQQCSRCGHIRFPASLVCPQCYAVEADWKRMSGKGTLYSYIIYHHAYHPAYQGDLPYAVGIVQLAEGPRMESSIVGCKLEDLKIDMPLEVLFEEVNDEVTLPKFRPQSG